MITGIVLFILSCMPTYMGSLHYHSYRYKHDSTDIKRSIRYDDELLYHTTTAIYDTVLARECTMERNAFIIQLNKLRQSIETRCRLYESIIKNSRNEKSLSTYYKKRVDDFRRILEQMPTC